MINILHSTACVIALYKIIEAALIKIMETPQSEYA